MAPELCVSILEQRRIELHCHEAVLLRAARVEELRLAQLQAQSGLTAV